MLKLQIRKRVNRRIKADISLTEKTENIHLHHLSKVHRDRKMDKDIAEIKVKVKEASK